MPPPPPRQKFFFSLFSQRMILSSKKLLYEEQFETSFLLKKVIFIFVIRCPLPFKTDFAHENSFSPFLSVKTVFFVFLEKQLNNKIFKT